MKLRWGVIAAGGIADRRMLPAMMASDAAEVVAVMDVDAAVAQKVAEKYGIVHWYATEEELLRHNDIDAVYIASPVYLHKRQAMMAADAQKHILLEKPVALNACEAQQITDYCNEKNVKVFAGFIMRFSTMHQKILQLLEQKQIGELVAVNALFSCWYPEIPGAWRQEKAKSGGGALMDMGLHLIDLVQYLTGSKITTVAAMNDRRRFSYEVEDTAALLTRFDNGMVGSLSAHFNIPDSAARWDITFFGTRGRIIGETTLGQVDGGRLLVIRESEEKSYDAQQDAQVAKEEIITGNTGDLFRFELESFTDSIINNKPIVNTMQQAVYDQKVSDAAYLSGETGAFITIE